MASKEEIFVGREDELEIFRQMLRNANGGKCILLLLGGGGIGKTKLVNQMLSVAKGESFLTLDSPIDLFSTDYRHIDGIQEKIIRLVEELTGQERNSGPFSGWVEGKTDTSEGFYKCLKEFCNEHPLVLAFDTFENLDKVASDWLFKGEPDGLQVPGLICIIAGRNNPDMDWLGTYRDLPIVNTIVLQGLTLKDAKEFYQEIEDESPDPLGDDLLQSLGLSPSEPIEEGLERIWYITEGHPLRLEMAFRWPRNILDGNSLADLVPERYEEKLMEYVREWGLQGKLPVGRKLIREPIFETLICMAYVVRRFDIKFLQFFIDEKIIRFSSDESISKEEVLEYLQQYFFVKTRGQTEDRLGIVQLHDEMARLVRKYVWPYIDPSSEQRDRIYQATIRYYDELIAQAGKTTSKEKELAETLQIEQLYYMLQLDPEETGLQIWVTLAELRNENINKLLPGEIKGYIDSYDIETRVLIHSKIADMEQIAYHIGQALGHWDEVKRLGEETGHPDWVVDSLRGKFNCVCKEDPEGALTDYLLPALEVCEREVPEKLSLVYYEIGFAYNQMQDLIHAAEWYEKGLRQFQQDPGESWLEATLYNDAGYAYLQMGNYRDAARYLKEALEIRQGQLQEADEMLQKAGSKVDPKLLAARSQAAYFAGLSYNTLGEYHRYEDDLDEALAKYEQAYSLFYDIGDFYWQAKSLCARGETYRRLAEKAWQEQGNGVDLALSFKLARKDIEESAYLCEKYQLDNERDTAYRRLGRLVHDEGMIAYKRKNTDLACEKMEEAYSCFQGGLKFSKDTNDMLEELENLTELAFLADDMVEIFGKEDTPEHYFGAVEALEEALAGYENNRMRIFWYPVFVSLLKLEKAAIAFAEGDYGKALDGFVEAFKELGTFPGYGHTRYKQHFPKLTSRIETLPREEQLRWRQRFIDEWTHTDMPGRPGRTLADDLIPDLVKWLNRNVKPLDKK